MGTSEIYRAVLMIPEVVDALVVDVPREGTDGRMYLFVVLDESASLSEPLIRNVKQRIRDQCSPRHVPDEIRAVTEVPRTLSGKLLEIPVKRILSGDDPARAVLTHTLANPGRSFVLNAIGSNLGTMFITFDPFHGLEPFPLPGPVFIHENECDRHPEHGGFPVDLQSHELTLAAYGRGRDLRAEEHVSGTDVEKAIGRLFARDDVDYLHVRDRQAGCYDLRLERV